MEEVPSGGAFPPANGFCSDFARFPPYRFQLSERRLFGPSGEIPLKPRSRSVLAHLLERRGHIVSKGELVEKVWEHAAVGDEAITQRVLEIRRALRDDPKAPSYIKTHPCMGYEFIANVQMDAPSREQEREKLAAAPPRSSWRVAVATALMAVATGGALLWQRYRPEPSGFRMERLTSSPALEESASPVRSTSSVVFVSWENGVPHLSLLDTRTGRAQRLTNGEGETEPDVSPDGALVAYRSEAGAGSVEVRALSGGAVISVGLPGHDPRWSPDGRSLAFAPGGPEDRVGNKLYVWDMPTKKTRVVTVSDPPPLGISLPVWSQDGRELYFRAEAKAYERSAQGLPSDFKGRQIWRTTLAGGTARLVTKGFGTLDGGYDLDWARRKLLFIGLDNCLQEASLNASGTAQDPVRLTATTERHAHPRAGANGVVYFTTVPQGTSFWQLGAGLDGKPELKRFTDDSLHALAPQLSPDGTVVAFQAYEGERIGIWGVDLASGQRSRFSPADEYARMVPTWRDNYTLEYWRADTGGRSPYSGTLSRDRDRLETEVRSSATPRHTDAGGACSVQIARSAAANVLTVSEGGKARKRLIVAEPVRYASCLPAASSVALLTRTNGRQELRIIPAFEDDPAPAAALVTALPPQYELVNVSASPHSRSLILTMRQRAGDLWTLRPR